MTAAIVVAVMLLLFGLSLALFVWSTWRMLKQVERQRDKAHADALRKNADHLETEGRLEAAEYFREYANLLSPRKP